MLNTAKGVQTLASVAFHEAGHGVANFHFTGACGDIEIFLDGDSLGRCRPTAPYRPDINTHLAALISSHAGNVAEEQLKMKLLNASLESHLIDLIIRYDEPTRVVPGARMNNVPYDRQNAVSASMAAIREASGGTCNTDAESLGQAWVSEAGATRASLLIADNWFMVESLAVLAMTQWLVECENATKLCNLLRRDDYLFEDSWLIKKTQAPPKFSSSTDDEIRRQIKREIRRPRTDDESVQFLLEIFQKDPAGVIAAGLAVLSGESRGRGMRRAVAI
jgi:hypothetical protein